MYSLEQINRILGALPSSGEGLENAKNTKELTYVERTDGHMGVSDNSYNDGEGVQGESNNYSLIYKVNFEENLFVKIDCTTDSYGYNDSIVSIQLVEGKEKTIIIYE